jgi:hypothetical protein
MVIGERIVVTTATVPPVTPAAPSAPRAVDSQTADRSRRDLRREEKATSFRAALAAEGTDRASSPLAWSSNEKVAAPAPPPERRPSSAIELDAARTSELYRASQSRPRSAASPEPASAPFAPAFFNATRAYAQRFFSLDTALAARGESLEVSA